MRRVALAGAAVVLSVVQLGAGAEGSGDVRAFLERMAEAERATYEARQLVVYLDDPQSAALLEVRSTPDGTFVRSEAGHDVTRVWARPGRGLVAGEGLAIEDASPPSVPLSPRRVLAKYAIEVGDPATFLGVAVVPLGLVRRSDRKLVERLWVHPDTGAVYRRELFGPQGDVVGMQTVLEMRWGASAPQDPWERAEAKVEPERDPDAPRELPYGYRLVRGYRMEMDGRESHHWVYTDGLHTLSLFRTAGSLERPDDFREAGESLWAGPGPGTWTWEGDEHTWVLLAEEPQLDPAALTEPLPKGGPSILSRLGSWWARAWGWVVDLVS